MKWSMSNIKDEIAKGLILSVIVLSVVMIIGQAAMMCVVGYSFITESVRLVKAVVP